MSTVNHKATVGAFTLGGLLLFAVALLLLGGGNLFNSTVEYVLYFDGSVSGLSIGAPVVFRGVPMGSVTRISLVAKPRDSSVTIPVYIRIDENSIVRASGKAISDEMRQKILRTMVDRGLRARLQIQSLITGQYRIELDFHENTQATFRSSTPALEIPTIPSPIDTLQRELSNVPLNQMIASLDKILLRLADALEGDHLQQGIASFAETFAKANQTLEMAQRIIQASTVLATTEKTLQQFDHTALNVNKELTLSMEAFRKTMTSMNQSAEKMKQTSASMNNLFEQNSPIVRDLRRLLKDTADAARSLHEMADVLARNPEVLLKGRKGNY